MKKLILSLSVLFGLSGASMAQTVSASDVEALPGEKVTATLNLSAPADAFTGIQMALQFPAEGFTMEAGGAIEGWNGSLEYGTMNEGKVKVAAAAAKTFESATLTVEFTVGADVAVGDYYVSVTDIVFEGADGNADAEDATFVVSVVDRHTVVLDENDTEAPEASEDEVNVTLKRTISADVWSTICLPFAATGEQVKAAFGNDVELASFSGVEVDEDNDNINMKFTAADAADGIEANTPMLIKVSADVESAEFENVSIEAEEEPEVQVGERRKYSYFRGTYAATLVPEENIFLSGNKFWYSTGASAIKGYRGYFDLYYVLDGYYDVAEVKVNILFNDEATGINSLTPALSEGEGAIYNLAGQRVSKAQHGINIVNGKKVIR